MSMIEIAVYGAGGFARELAWLIETCNEPVERYRVVSFIDDNPSLHGTVLNAIPVWGLEEVSRRFPRARVVSGVGAPKTRQLLMEKAAMAGFDFETIIHPRTEMSPFVSVGKGTVICAGNILTTNISLGEHVQINLDCTVGHDVVLGDYTTLSPGVHVSGWVHFGARVFVGTGATIINGTADRPLLIGDDAVIGAGACVTKAVPAGVTVVGVPARPFPGHG